MQVHCAFAFSEEAEIDFNPFVSIPFTSVQFTKRYKSNLVDNQNVIISKRNIY